MKRYIVFAALALLLVCSLCVSVSAACYDCGGEFVDGVCSDCGSGEGEEDIVWYCQDCGALANEMECPDCWSGNVDTVKPDLVFAVCPNCETSFRVTERGKYQCPAEDCRENLYVSADGHVVMYSNLPEIECPCCPEFMTQGYDDENNMRLMEYICHYCGFSLYLDGGGDSRGSYEDGYNDGYDEGYHVGETDGFTDGKNQGYTEGYNKGKADGYSEGYNKGHDAGTENGEQSGFASGYDAGLEEGYNEGKADGYSEGYDAGLDNGWHIGYADAVDEGIGRYDHGYNNGFRDGVAKGESNDVSGKFMHIVGEIAFAPYRAVSTMFDFEIFGINIAGLIFELVTIISFVAVVFFAIKLFV